MQAEKRPTYAPGDYGQVRLYGLPLTGGAEGLNLGAVTICAAGGTVKAVRSASAESELNAGLIVGYAYEGACYDLPKPKIIFTTAEAKEIPVDDCGYDAKTPAGYRLWLVDKRDICVELESTEGLVEQLVLESNMPGKRSQGSYRAVMQVAHRNGRLTD